MKLVASVLSVCVYLWSTGQCEQQVKSSLGEVKVVLGSQAELNTIEHWGEDWNLPHHWDPVLAILICATQFLCQVQRQHTHLVKLKKGKRNGFELNIKLTSWEKSIYSAHPVSLVLLWVARTVRLHAVFILCRVSTLAHLSSIVNKCQGLVFHRLTHRQQQLGQLGNIST